MSSVKKASFRITHLQMGTPRLQSGPDSGQVCGMLTRDEIVGGEPNQKDEKKGVGMEQEEFRGGLIRIHAVTLDDPLEDLNCPPFFSCAGRSISVGIITQYQLF